jgi:hypothetical protein
VVVGGNLALIQAAAEAAATAATPTVAARLGGCWVGAAGELGEYGKGYLWRLLHLRRAPFLSLLIGYPNCCCCQHLCWCRVSILIHLAFLVCFIPVVHLALPHLHLLPILLFGRWRHF